MELGCVRLGPVPGATVAASLVQSWSDGMMDAGVSSAVGGDVLLAPLYAGFDSSYCRVLVFSLGCVLASRPFPSRLLYNAPVQYFVHR